MKTITLLLLLLIPTIAFSSNETTENTKKEIVSKKANDIIDVKSYIKTLKLKTTKTKLC
jgi:hypothetical protein